MTKVLADPEVVRLTGSAHTTAEVHSVRQNPDQIHQWYSTRDGTAGDRLDLAIVDRSAGRVVGEVVLNDWDPANRSCNFRTLIGPDGRNRGLGTEATRLVVDHTFGVLGVHRIELEVYAFNPRARRAYEKAGFQREGTRRHALRFDGEWIDAHVMSVLAQE